MEITENKFTERLNRTTLDWATATPIHSPSAPVVPSPTLPVHVCLDLSSTASPPSRLDSALGTVIALPPSVTITGPEMLPEQSVFLPFQEASNNERQTNCQPAEVVHRTLLIQRLARRTRHRDIEMKRKERKLKVSMTGVNRFKNRALIVVRKSDGDVKVYKQASGREQDNGRVLGISSDGKKLLSTHAVNSASSKAMLKTRLK